MKNILQILLFGDSLHFWQSKGKMVEETVILAVAANVDIHN